jgi:hypothetical protein
MFKKRDGLRRVPLPLLFALVVLISATVVLVVQIAVLPPPPAVVAPLDSDATTLSTGSQTFTYSVTAFLGRTVVYTNLAALGYVSLNANTTGWYYQVNDWVFTVIRRSTGDASISISSASITLDIHHINATHALVVNRGRNTAVIAKVVSAGSWYVYHPVAADYTSDTTGAITGYMSSKGLSALYVFQPKYNYIEFDQASKTYRVYFDYVAASGSVTSRGYSLTNSTDFVALPSGSGVIPSGTYYLADTNNIVLAPIWVLLVYTPTSDTNSALTVEPQLPP